MAEIKKASSQVMDRKVYYPGQVVFNEGEEGHRAFLVQEGEIEIIKTMKDGSEKILGTIGPGGLFGEMALIDDAPRMATARALEQSSLVLINRTQFNARLEKADPFIRALLSIFVRNIRAMAEKK